MVGKKVTVFYCHQRGTKLGLHGHCIREHITLNLKKNNFIEVCFMYHNSLLFQEYNSVILVTLLVRTTIALNQFCSLFILLENSLLFTCN